MTSPDQHDRNSAAIISDLEQYFIDISIRCPYELPHTATYHQALFHSLNPKTMGDFLGRGYRRNGNCVYAMHCRTCRSCVPIRLLPARFRPNRNQRRVLKKNSDVSVGIAPLSMSEENLELLDRFLRDRFPATRNSAEEYYSGFFLSTITRCFEIRYRVADTLMGVAVVDADDCWLNAVYFFFDPRRSRRSPGTFNILYLIDFCRRNGFEYLYLGYQIEEVGAMNYKARFKPHQLLVNGTWKASADRSHGS